MSNYDCVETEPYFSAKVIICLSEIFQKYLYISTSAYICSDDCALR